MSFNADLVIRYLTEVLKIEEPEQFQDLPLKKDFIHMMEAPKDEWNLEFVEDAQILEIMILEQLLLSRAEAMNLEELMDEFYYPHFNPTFFDPEPRPVLSIAGWLNFNISKDHEKQFDRLPSLSLSPVVDIIKLLSDASPTCDELVNEYITDMYLEFRDNEDDEGRIDFFRGEAADRMYDMSKALRKVGVYIKRLAENSFEDDIAHNLGILILDDLEEEFLDVFLADFEDYEYDTHPLLLIKNQVEYLRQLYPSN